MDAIQDNSFKNRPKPAVQSFN